MTSVPQIDAGPETRWSLRCMLFGHDMGRCHVRGDYQTWYCLRCGFSRTWHGSTECVVMLRDGESIPQTAVSPTQVSK